MAKRMTLEQLERALKRLVRGWPPGYWLFATDGGLNLMKCGPDGEHVIDEMGGMDRDYVVGFYRIPSDGGDW